jgi:N-succinyldiaminopimelate aminotransferase
LIYICNPSNPTGAVPPKGFYQRLIALADQYDFIIASDECYSEIYFNEMQPPLGLLAVCRGLGRNDYHRCLVFNSLSKRSNLAGMRSGFVAGCGNTLKNFLRYRTYHGSAMPNHHQAASIAAWGDETHVIENRCLYREKMRKVFPIVEAVAEVSIPPAGFCLWLKTPIDDQQLVQYAFQYFNLKLLPGQYLGRTIAGYNPGRGYIRMALVQPLEVCIEGAQRFVAAVKALTIGK